MSTTSKIKPGFKIFLALAIAGLVYVVAGTELIFKKDVKQTVQINQVILPNAPKDIATGAVVTFAPLPSNDVAVVNSTRINFDIMAWNSQMGLILANGGPMTTKGSLMEKRGVNLKITRQDDCNQAAANLIKFANDYKNNPTTATGTNLYAIMGDGAPAWLSSINAELSKLGDEYIAQIIFSCGKSSGEDQFMAPQTVKENPQSARGMVCSAVLRDGDWNIVIKWCSDNGIPINTDEKTYNPDAMNFVAANDFIDAAQKYISGYSEERDVVKTDSKTGKTTRTGDKKKITVDCSTTWTPGDVMIAENKGGLVRIVSTAEYASQMPNVVIGIKKWLKDNKTNVVNMITAISEGGDQIKTYDEALTRAAELSAKVYGDKDGSYWKKYYKGVTQSDAQGKLVQLGGSKVHNLADNLELFGQGNNHENVYASVYKVFGDIVSGLYPENVKTYPEIKDVLDLSYILEAKTKSGNLTSADQITYNNTSNMSETVAKRAWSIEFQTGSANFTPEALQVLNNLNDQLNVASALQIEIFGHTDNTGTSDGNMSLSEARAQAVKNWLQQKSSVSYPESRFIQVKGKGQNEPVADNNTSSGKAKNRRVEIIMGK